jgi:hypothetical protein
VSDLDVLKAIVDAFERSDWAEIDVRSGSLRIHLGATADNCRLSGDVDRTSC